MEVLQRTANRGSISTGYDIDNSVKLQTSGVNSEFFNYTIGTTGNRTKGTVSMWIKRTSLGTLQYLWEQSGADNESGRILVRFGTDDTLRIATGSTVLRNTNRVFRDTSAWYHIVVTIDTTSGTADNRTRLYVNGVEETSFSTKTNFSQNDNTGMNFGAQWIGLSIEDESSFQSFNGYMAEVFGADGLVYAASDFGEFDSSGIWKPIDITGLSVGTNGFLMKFENAGSMGANSAGSGHGFSVQNINQNDQATDVPSNNFCTWSTLWNYATSPTMTEGATKVVEGTGSWGGAKSSIGVANGKWYWELKVSSGSALTGIQTDGDGNIASGNAQAVQQTMALYYTGTMVEAYDSGGNRDDTNVTFTYNANDTYGIALDMDSSTQTISFYQNGSLITNGGNINIDGLGGNTVFPFAANNGSTTTVNFGGYTTNTISSAASDANGYGTFEYAPPSGYYAICTKNLAEFG